MFHIFAYKVMTGKNNCLLDWPMTFSPFEQMQRAVNVVLNSSHPTNKIAATVFGTDRDGNPFSVSHTNYWPEKIEKEIGTELRVGNASGTIHAETAAILAAPHTDGASICVTDPFCPNCAKNIAEAGIKTIYIDHKGFDKDFITRRENVFDDMSMRICERAGISVYQLWRKEERLEPILEPPANYSPPEENPVIIETTPIKSAESFKRHLNASRNALRGIKHAVAIACDREGRTYVMTARAHPVLGFTLQQNLNEIEKPQGKYSFIQEPVNRLLMAAPRHGLKIQNGLLYASQLPTSREQVNIVGANLTEIYIGEKDKARDDYASQAMAQLQSHNILTFLEI